MIINNPIKSARNIMRRRFDEDNDFKDVYIANIAMLLYDMHGGRFQDPSVRNKTAEKILDLIFGKCG